MSKFSVISQKNVLPAELFDVNEVKIIKENGKSATWYYVKQKPIVFILALTKDNELYLIKQFRYTIQKMSLEIPAGYLHKNEDPLNGAKRELREETGLTADTWTPLGEKLAGVGAITGTHHYFLAEDFHQGEQDQDDMEDIEVIKLSLKKVVDMAFANEITIATNITGIFLLKEFLVKRGLF